MAGSRRPALAVLAAVYVVLGLFNVMLAVRLGALWHLLLALLLLAGAGTLAAVARAGPRRASEDRGFRARR